MDYRLMRIRLLNDQGASVEEIFVGQGDSDTSTNAEVAGEMALAFVKACGPVDVSQPITEAHERVLASAIVDVANMAMTDPAIARVVPKVTAIQIDPCPAVPLAQALDLVDRYQDAVTAKSARDILAGQWAGQLRAIARASDFRPN